jgi:protein subunit release factor A
LHAEIKAHQQNRQDLEEMIKETTDKDEKAMLAEERVRIDDTLAELKEQIWELLIPPAPYDKADDIILEFRPGAGGA